MFDLDPLAHPVDVTTSTTRVIPAKIEFKLRKATVGIKWAQLEGDDVSSLSTMSAASCTFA